MATTNQQQDVHQILVKASQKWSLFNLDSRRPHLDQTSATTRESREQSQLARKQLAESTKQFKKSVKAAEQAASALGGETPIKSSMDGLSTQCRSIVKSYQGEIDKLTRRCKASDASFLDLYKGIQDLPDPAPILTKALEQLDNVTGQVTHLLKGMEEIQNELETRGTKYEQEFEGQAKELTMMKNQLEERKMQYETLKVEMGKQAKAPPAGTSLMGKEEKEELISLRRDVAEYEMEFKALKNQDITIKKLNLQIEKLVESQEDELQKELKKAQDHLAQTEGRRATEALEREAIAQRRLESLELELKAERAGSEAAQAHLLEADEGLSEREAAWEAQREILVHDANRLREELYTVKRERDDLKMKHSALSDTSSNGEGLNEGDLSMGASDFIAERKAYEAEVSELTFTVTTMREEIRTKDENMVELQRSMQASVDSLDNERGFLTEQIKSLQIQLAETPSKENIDNMRRELRILKRLEYNAVDVDEQEEPEMTTSGAGDDTDDLEAILITKLRKAEADLLVERREKNGLSSNCKELKEKITVLKKEKDEADALAIRLESDLEKAIVAPTTSLSVKQIPELPANPGVDGSTLQQILDPTSKSSKIATSNTVAIKSNSASDKQQDDHSVATIVMAQRDRLRARCDALEAERDSFKRELQVQVSTSESLKSDNTKLYEKVRYFQNFNSHSGQSFGALHSRHKGALADRDLDLEALEQRYEASVDPFRQFSRAERQRKLNEMSPMERVVFIVARTVLGSKEMRTFLFFYVVGMHLLVFSTTYHWSHGCSSGPDYEAISSMQRGVPIIEEQP